MNNSTVIDFIKLLKPGVMVLVVFTGVIGMLLPDENPDIFTLIVGTICIILGSGASGVINMWYDRDIDMLMTRTINRPIPRGKIGSNTAIEFGVILAILSVLTMSIIINLISGMLLLSAILFYVFIYTIYLKRRTPQNIVIGGAAGAFPPVIGWAVTTGEVSLNAIILFMIIFTWTPPHFWALAIYKNDDYIKAKIPMLPVVKGVKYTKINIIIYSFLLLTISILPYIIGMSSILYLAGASILGLQFFIYSILVFYDKTDKFPRKMFKFSIFYLFILFGILLLDKIIIG